MKTVNQKINEFLTKEVHRLEKRVADLHEKYPEDGFGCKDDEMCWEHEDQIERETKETEEVYDPLKEFANTLITATKTIYGE